MSRTQFLSWEVWEGSNDVHVVMRWMFMRCVDCMLKFKTTFNTINPLSSSWPLVSFASLYRVPWRSQGAMLDHTKTKYNIIFVVFFLEPQMLTHFGAYVEPVWWLCLTKANPNRFESVFGYHLEFPLQNREHWGHNSIIFIIFNFTVIFIIIIITRVSRGPN